MSKNPKAIRNLRLTPQVAIDRSQTNLWIMRWQEGERQAEKNIQSGHVKNFDNVDVLIADLESDE